MDNSPPTLIGDALNRVDGPAKVTGTAMYAGDYKIPEIYLCGRDVNYSVVVWVVKYVSTTNAVDGLDGLSSGIAAISSLALLAVAVNFANPATSAAMLLLAAIAGASLGFLRQAPILGEYHRDEAPPACAGSGANRPALQASAQASHLWHIQT